MPAAHLILAIDQGTTSTRAVLFDRQAKVVAVAQKELTQYYPQPGWVEHDPRQIWDDCFDVCAEVMAKQPGGITAVAAIGITNQRETTILWRRDTGEPIGRAIVWQDRRTAAKCHELIDQGYETLVQQKTGLLLDPYFSATKLQWMLDQSPDIRKLAEQGMLAFGTVESFLLWHLTGGQVHATDVTNASRTLLMNIHTLDWDADLLQLFNIPRAVLPEIKPNVALFGETMLWNHPVPITAMIGDQQSALVGQGCFTPGSMKITYGTGCFALVNTGEVPVTSKHRLLTTVGYWIDDKPVYALEGSIFNAGTIVQWLRDNLHFFATSEATEEIVQHADPEQAIYFVPAFTGLGAPYWDSEARGAIMGLTRGTQTPDIVKAGLMAVAYQTRDLLEAIQADLPYPIHQVQVDGGMVKNQWLVQAIADVTGQKIVVPEMNESTACGAGYLAGRQVGFYGEECDLHQPPVFIPKMPENQRQALYLGWLDAIKRVRTNI